MAETKADTPKRKYLVWSDGEEVKVMDCGYDYHTNVKTQAIIKGERDSDGKASYRQVKNVNNGTDFANDITGNGKL